MARKKKTKTTQYTKNRKRILAYIRRQRKKNLVTDLYIPTERELRKQGVKGTELAKLTRELKALNPKTLESHFYDPFGNPRYWDRDEALKNKDKLPDGGETIYKNVFDEFISRMSAPLEDSKRRPDAKYESERQKQTLYTLAISIAKIDGESAVGWRLQKADNLETYIQYILYGSRAELVNTTAYKLATIIKGTPLSRDELSDLQDESEFNENWDAPI